jgi:hypothetical protein
MFVQTRFCHRDLLARDDNVHVVDLASSAQDGYYHHPHRARVMFENAQQSVSPFRITTICPCSRCEQETVTTQPPRSPIPVPLRARDESLPVTALADGKNHAVSAPHRKWQQ